MSICVRCKREGKQGFSVKKQFYCVSCLEQDDHTVPRILMSMTNVHYRMKAQFPNMQTMTRKQLEEKGLLDKKRELVTLEIDTIPGVGSSVIINEMKEELQ